uniref:Colicin E9 n=1 Tax=Siphoviridae sp. ctClL93 TaxID=2825381 RepID=A0A8S5VE87_9CAUD|nr:MAG TPA: colicin E9 [Siphoviridae sp. ctClL93]
MEVLTREAFLHTDFCNDGSGSGSGYGYGDGSGYGYGDGSGSGSGYGDGDGSGYGDGSGSGYGSGSGDGLKSLNGQPVDMIDGVPTILTRIIGNVAKGFIVGPDFLLAPTFVCKQGNTFAHGETLHKAREALLEKLFDDMPTEERIEAFCAEFKSGVKRPAMDFFSWHHRLTGSCEQGRREFARQHDVDIDSDTLTPEEFFALTRDSYGGSIIKQAEKEFALRNGEIAEAEE